ncbi:ribosomal RNA small subunit methyltransferase I [Halomonas cupida]|uniref:Ribosomal RNA small subunit methyltransferase I n=1 Tax=Halomonas cupida TaxID=44933 RepID=A0A1M7A0F4_9GAMM|nr:16S rRNA (cytidine(1402)-2'-O)-methyltransferase [Halomonas cupida]GEN22579.1 ribosomal RNA small subunit methyltransferase I [Halomonas cupida]SHL36241.1 16S rRNA (cytidine1402-2'-O)-methyltransferase [Halomonas cupida]
MPDTNAGSLYVVATPIGNLDDLSARASSVLAQVSLVAAEDTRHSARLMRHLGIAPKMISLHDHNEGARVAQLATHLANGEDVALISDAGTPLISDPGYVLVRELRAGGYRVIPVPGPCALVTALCAAGLPTDRFTFHGFLPAKGSARRGRLEQWIKAPETLVFYESPHRIRDTLTDIAGLFGARRVVLGRELTKTFETFLDGDAGTLLEQMAADPDQARGEFVVMVEGAPEVEKSSSDIDAEALLGALLAEGVGVKQAAAIAARVLGGSRKSWYARAQTLKDGD